MLTFGPAINSSGQGRPHSLENLLCLTFCQPCPQAARRSTGQKPLGERPDGRPCQGYYRPVSCLRIISVLELIILRKRNEGKGTDCRRADTERRWRAEGH